MYDKSQIINCLKKYGWSRNRCIDTSSIAEFYKHFFDRYKEEDYETFVFKPYTPFKSVIDFWSSFGNLTINFIAVNNCKGHIVITENALSNEGIHDIIQTSIYYNIKIFPIAMVEIVPCFLCIDEKGIFYGINYVGGVIQFGNDFLELVGFIV